jgi:hypothetical protein
MMRLLLFFVVLAVLPLTIKGQVTVSVDPSTFVLTGHPSQTDIIYHIYVTNTSSEPANLYWSRRITGAPVQWLNWVCDNNLCFDPSVNSCPASKPNLVLPGGIMELQLHLNPLNTEGASEYDINVLDDQGNVLLIIDGSEIISTTTAVKDASDPKLTVFPNPTNDFFQVSETPGLRSIEIFNIVGSKVRSYDATPQKQYYVGDLNEGIYLVRLVSSSQKVLKTIRLSKR